MPVEKSAGAVVFCKTPADKIEYLLLEYRAGHWAFPKGLREETGIADFDLMAGFKETEKYFFKVKYDYQIKERGWRKGEGVLKFVTYFLAEAKSKDVRLSFEHEDFAWLEFAEALEKITYKGAREILKKAEQFLSVRHPMSRN